MLDPLSIRIDIEKNSKIKIDDILDSMVLFITALRIVKGNFLCLEKTKIENNDDNGQILYKFKLKLWSTISYY